MRRWFAGVSLIVFMTPTAGLSLPQEGPVPTAKGEPEATEDAPAVDDSVVPPEQKEQLAVFTGTWRCSGKANTDIAVEVPTSVTLAFKADLDGRWLTLRSSEQKSKLNPRALTSTEVWGFSEALGGFVRNGADSQGGFYEGSSAGWVGERFSWTVDTVRQGKRAKFKDVFTKKGPKELGFERAFDPTGTGDGFRVVFEGTCKR